MVLTCLLQHCQVGDIYSVVEVHLLSQLPPARHRWVAVHHGVYIRLGHCYAMSVVGYFEPVEHCLPSSFLGNGTCQGFRALKMHIAFQENNKKYINNNAFSHSQQEKKPEMASNMLVRDIMSKDVKVVNNNTSVQEVVATMTKYDKDAILIVQSGKPTGIITVKDVLVRALEHGVPLNSIIARMIYTNPLVTIDENKSVEEAANLMKHWKIKHLPVTQNEALVGIVTDRDIIYAVPQLMSVMEEFCRPKE